MDRFLIVFPNEERLDFFVSKLKQELFIGECFPLFESIEEHIKRHGKKTKDAKVYEVVDSKECRRYIHLTTLR